MISTIKRNSVAYQIIDRIIYMIQQGIIKPGDRLPSERDLASSFVVSRSSIRAAIQILAQNGIFDIKHGSGTYFQSIPDHVMETFMRLPTSETTQERKNFVQLNESRLVLEPTIGRLAALYITSDQLARLDAIVSHMEELVASHSHGGYALEDMSFHLLCAEATQNTSLYRIAREYCLDINFLFAFGTTPNLEEESLIQHKEIFLAIKNHDPAKAEKLLRDHVLYSLKKNLGYVHDQDFLPRKGVLS